MQIGRGRGGRKREWAGYNHFLLMWLILQYVRLIFDIKDCFLHKPSPFLIALYGSQLNDKVAIDWRTEWMTDRRTDWPLTTIVIISNFSNCFSLSHIHIYNITNRWEATINSLSVAHAASFQPMFHHATDIDDIPSSD